MICVGCGCAWKILCALSFSQLISDVGNIYKHSYIHMNSIDIFAPPKLCVECLVYGQCITVETCPFFFNTIFLFLVLVVSLSSEHNTHQSSQIEFRFSSWKWTLFSVSKRLFNYDLHTYFRSNNDFNFLSLLFVFCCLVKSEMDLLIVKFVPEPIDYGSIVLKSTNRQIDKATPKWLLLKNISVFLEKKIELIRIICVLIPESI